MPKSSPYLTDLFFFDGKSSLYWSKTYDVACKFIVYWLAFSFLYSLNKTAVETIFTRIQQSPRAATFI